MENPKRSDEEINADLLEIFFDKESLAHQAYFDSGHILHERTVEKVEALSREKLGEGLWNPEIMPRHIDADSLKLKEKGE